MRATQSLKFKLTVLLVAAILVPLLVSNILNIRNNTTYMRENVFNQNMQLVNSLGRQLTTLTTDIQDTVVTLAETKALQSMNPDAMSDVLLSTVDNMPMISQIYVMDTTGMQIYKTSGTLADRSDRDYFQKALAGEPYFSDILISGTTNMPIVVIAAPVKDGGKTVGVVGASIDLSELSVLSSAVQTGKTGYGFIVESSGKLIAHPDRELITSLTDVSDLEPVQEAILGKSGISLYDYEGDRKMAAYTYIPSVRWGVVVQTPHSEAFEGLTKQRTTMLTLLGIFAVLGFATAYILTKWITTPLLALSKQTATLAEGNLTGAIPDKLKNRKDEFGQLAQGFNAMQESTKDILVEIQSLTGHARNASGTILSLSEQMGHTSEDIAQTINAVAEGATNQAQETSRSSEVTSDLAALIERINSKLQQSVALTEKMSAQNAEGQDAIGAFSDLFDDNMRLTQRSVNVVSELSEKSTFINTIIGTIQSISEQTSLLALNASIEAARAGEHGRGFAVVADEVRKLAGQSNEATEEIRERMAEIADLIQRAEEAMLASQDVNQKTASNLGETTALLNEVGHASNQVSTQVESLHGDMHAVAGSKDQVLESIENVSVVAQQSAAATEEVSASVEEMTASIQEIVSSMHRLNELVETLSASTNRFVL